MGEMSRKGYTLHDLGEAHSFVDTRDGERQVLHHVTHNTILVRYMRPRVLSSPAHDG